MKAWLDRSRTHLDIFAEASGLNRFEQLRPRLDAVCTAYIARALREAGSNPVVGVEFEPENLANELGIISAHRRLFGRFLEILAEDNVLELTNDRGRWLLPLPAFDIAATMDELRQNFAEFEATLAMTERCGARLSAVLTGQADPLHLLFPAGDLTTAEKLYQYSPSARTLNPLVREAIKAAVSAWPAERSIRVLEVGAGTGATTAHVLPVLPFDRAHYVFTDLSPLFLARAKAKFADFQNVSFQLLDLEDDLSASRAPSQELRYHYRVERDSCDIRRDANTGELAPLARARGLATHAGGDTPAALVRRHLWPHRRLVAVPRSRFAHALPSALASPVETTFAANRFRSHPDRSGS